MKIDISDKERLLGLISSSSGTPSQTGTQTSKKDSLTSQTGQEKVDKKYLDSLNENKQNILHLLAGETCLKDAGSLCGNTEMTLYTIVEKLLKAKKVLAFSQDTQNGYTPLHIAFKNGNIEIALWIVAVMQNFYGPESLNELLNITDFDGMRPVDLLAFRVDDDHKQFLKEFHRHEKNYKVKKEYEVYSWGRSDDFQLGYPLIKDERQYPTKVAFNLLKQETKMAHQNCTSSTQIETTRHDEQTSNKDTESSCEEDRNSLASFKEKNVSIRDMVCCQTFSLALSEKGQVFAWGRGSLGHLGNGKEVSQIYPELVKFDFREEQKKINRAKREQPELVQPDELEDLLFRKNFLKQAASARQKNGGGKISVLAKHQSAVEQECLLKMNRISAQKDLDVKISERKKAILMMQLTEDAYLEEQTEVKLALMRMNKVCVTKIVCSNKHSLACTNTGSVFAWGQNDNNQLGYRISKQSQQSGGESQTCKFSATPMRVEVSERNFFVDVACGDNHSIILNANNEAFLWGLNSDGQCGVDPENHPSIRNPRKLLLSEFMNSSNSESVTSIQAKNNFTVLQAESKHTYISSRNSENPLVPVFGQTLQSQNGRKHGGHLGALKKIDHSVYLADSYILGIDQQKSIYIYHVQQRQAQQARDQDRRIAIEIFSGPSNFIEIHPTEKAIWALNSLRQLFVCQGENFASVVGLGPNSSLKTPHKLAELHFEPINSIYNVMKACIGEKHQSVLKIVKKLDTQMVRNIDDQQAKEELERELPGFGYSGRDDEMPDLLEIPRPTYGDFGDSDQEIQEPEQSLRDFNEEKEPQKFIPSLADHCVQTLSQNLSIESVLTTLQYADLHQIEELKINCLKFISLNVVSFLENNTIEKIFQLPVYLLRDLENFLKASDIRKFNFFSMHGLEKQVEESIAMDVLTREKQKQIDSQDTGLPSKIYCMEIYSKLINMQTGDQGVGSEAILAEATKFKKHLRKALKRTRKVSLKGPQVLKENEEEKLGEINRSRTLSNESTSDLDVVNEYLKMVSDLVEEIKSVQNKSESMPTEEELERQKILAQAEEEKENECENVIDRRNSRLESEEQKLDQEQTLLTPTVILKRKRKGGKNNKGISLEELNQQQKNKKQKSENFFKILGNELDNFSLQNGEKVNPEDGFDKIFLSKDSLNSSKNKEQKGDANYQDFALVQQCDKSGKIKHVTNKTEEVDNPFSIQDFYEIQDKSNKIQIKSSKSQVKPQIFAGQPQSNEGKSLATLLATDLTCQLNESKKSAEKEQAEKAKKVWNYLNESDSSNQQNSNQISSKTKDQTSPKAAKKFVPPSQNDSLKRPKLSFEEIMREEREKLAPVTRTQIIVDEARHGRDFATKHSWGMKQESGPITDFESLLKEQEKKREKDMALKRKQMEEDARVAKELSDSLALMSEQEMIQMAISKSLQATEEEEKEAQASLAQGLGEPKVVGKKQKSRGQRGNKNQGRPKTSAQDQSKDWSEKKQQNAAPNNQNRRKRNGKKQSQNSNQTATTS